MEGKEFSELNTYCNNTWFAHVRDLLVWNFVRVDLLQIERTGYELIREGMKVLEDEIGKACNRETISRAKLSKLMTMTSEDFEENTEIIGTSQMLCSEDFFTLGNR